MSGLCCYSSVMAQWLTNILAGYQQEGMGKGSLWMIRAKASKA